MALACGCLPLSLPVGVKTMMLSGSRGQLFTPLKKQNLFARQTTLLRTRFAASRRQGASDSHLQVVSQANDLIRVVATVVKTVRDGVESGTNVVPDSVPRPAARVIVAVVGLLAIFFVFNSLVSTVSFFLGIGGLAYVAYIYFNKDNDSSSGGGGAAGGGGDRTEKSLEEARKIMEKYK